MNKKLRDYMKLPYTIVLRRDEEGDFIARIKEFEGCVADGQDEMEALGNLELVKALWIETALKSGQTIPLPNTDEELPSGKFLTRVPRSLHKSLVDVAQLEGISLNQLVTVALAEVVGRKSAMRAMQIEINASAHNQQNACAYGSGKSLTRLRLVGQHQKRDSATVKSRLLDESTMADVLSMELGWPASQIRKEA